MVPLVQALEPFLGDQRVDLRRRQRAVAEHQLQRAQIGAMVQQMRRERMAQHVRRDALRRNPGRQRVFFTSVQNIWRVIAARRLLTNSASLRPPLSNAGRASPT